MNAWLVLVGLSIVGWTSIEVFWTAIGYGGAPVTKFFASRTWILARRLFTRTRPKLLAPAGIVIFISAIFFWIFSLWVGWTLVFCGSESAVIRSSDSIPATINERIYFAGYSLFTLGLGDYRPGGDLWRILTAVSVLNGLFVVTFSVTYLVPVAQANVGTRRTAVWIGTLGTTPDRIAARLVSGEGALLEQHLLPLVPEITQIEQQHIAYPILHYLRARDESASFALAIARLDEALTLLADGAANACEKRDAVLVPARDAIGGLLSTLRDAFIAPAETPPPPPDLEAIRDAGLEPIPRARFEERLKALAARRKLLRGFVEQLGWSWKDVTERRGSGRM